MDTEYLVIQDSKTLEVKKIRLLGDNFKEFSVDDPEYQDFVAWKNSGNIPMYVSDDLI
jgi:hypothetical protein